MNTIDRSIDKKNYVELLNEIHSKIDSFGTSRRAQRLVGVIDSVIPVEEKPVEETPGEEEIVDEENNVDALEEKTEEKMIHEETSKDNGSESKTVPDEAETSDESITVAPKIKKDD